MTSTGASFGKWLRTLPWSVLILLALGLALALAWALDSMIGFQHARLGEAVALLGVLFLALPVIQLNALQRQRSNLDDLLQKVIARANDDFTDAEKRTLDADIQRLAAKSDEARKQSTSWSASTELCLLAGYTAVLAASLGRLVFG